MKRAEVLVPLSREHHQALVFAKRLLDAQLGGESELMACWGNLQLTLRAHLLPHFKVEEVDYAAKLPIVMREQLLMEHRQLLTWLDTTNPEEVVSFAQLLKAHVRFEERDVFPWLELHGLE